jgi:transcriptional regulator
MTMYVPPSFDVSDGRILEAFINRYGFATLITSSSAGLIASHIPITLRKRGEANCLIGHVARANNQWRTFDGGAEALVIFHGPHAYVSPAWYVTSPAVPTWNYAAVHVYGKPAVSADIGFAKAALVDLVDQYESTRSKPWRADVLAPDLFDKLASAIVAFEMPVERIEGNFKLGQNRSREDRAGMLAGLEREGSLEAELLARFIREHGGV